ncbi:Wzz/FepE/Etk N-terminal domain-containing protein, partial [Flavobacterium sp.]|uniref:Wzz/FepE/Etk N-terminal domain-containing protein n=1 Tax=Flavobacterium sp. TaxID=239 RepID=UPI002615FEAD
MENSMSNEEFEKDFDLKAEIQKYSIHWKWFLLAIIAFLCVAYYKVRYAVPVYNASISIIMKDNEKGGRLSEAAAFSDLGISDGSRNVEDEIEIMRSRTLLEEVVKKLKFNIAIFSEGQVLNHEMYEDAPIGITFINQVVDFDERFMSLQFHENTDGTFSLADDSGTSLLQSSAKCKYGQPIKTILGDLIMTKKTSTKLAEDFFLSIVVSPIRSVAAGFKARLTIAPIKQGSKVLVLNVFDEV